MQILYDLANDEINIEVVIDSTHAPNYDAWQNNVYGTGADVSFIVLLYSNPTPLNSAANTSWNCTLPIPLFLCSCWLSLRIYFVTLFSDFSFLCSFLPAFYSTFKSSTTCTTSRCRTWPTRSTAPAPSSCR